MRDGRRLGFGVSTAAVGSDGRTRPSKIRTRGDTVRCALESAGMRPWFPSFAAAASAGALFGYDIGSSSAVLRVLGNGQLNPSQLSALASTSLLGALLSSVIVSRLKNVVGRKTELKAAALLYGAGTLIQTLSPGFPVLILGRLVYGLGIGTAMHAAPLLISESVPSEIRGSLVAFKEAFIVAGILAGYLSGAGFASFGDESWRWMFGAAILLEVPTYALASIAPETPRWLCLRASIGGERDEFLAKAEENQTILNGGDEQQAKADVANVFAALQDVETKDREQTSMLDTPGAKPALKKGLGLVAFQQFTGQPSVLYYANRIFEQVGIGFSGAVAVGVFKLVTTIASAAAVENYGRKPLLIAGTSVMTACLAALAVTFAGIQPGADFSGPQQVAIISAVILYVGGYQIGFGPVSWLMLSELFPLKVRGQALATGTLTNFGTNLLVTATFEPLRQFMGSSGLFASFALVGVAAIIFEASQLPETRGRTLEEIEAMMQAEDR